MNTKTQIELPRSACSTITQYLDEHGIQWETVLYKLKTKTISVQDLPLHALDYIRGVISVTVDQPGPAQSEV